MRSRVFCGLIGRAPLLIARSFGRELTDVCQSLANARTEVAEQSAYIRSHWSQTKAQLDIARSTWVQLSADHQAIQLQVLAILVGKLETSRVSISSGSSACMIRLSLNCLLYLLRSAAPDL